MGLVEDIRAARTKLTRAHGALRRLPLRDRAQGIALAARELLADQTALGASLRTELLAQTRLSLPVIEHGLHSTLALFEPEPLLALFAGRPGDRIAQSAVVFLAGNVFTAAARPLLLPLLCGTTVFAKAASADDVLPRYLARALRAVNPRLGDAIAITTFSRHERAEEEALLEHADLVSVYGNDDTVAAIRGRLHQGSKLVAHGHGLGMMFISRSALGSVGAARALAARAALDIAAYDQRGCLSPHAALVEPGPGISAREFAALLGEALEAIEQDRPRGMLYPAELAAEASWRSVAAALGELHKRATWAVSYEGSGAFRASPGFRNFAVYECKQLLDRIKPLGPHLKALGVGGAAARRESRNLAPYVCAVGNMQTPPLDCPLDGLHPLHGYCG